MSNPAENTFTLQEIKEPEFTKNTSTFTIHDPTWRLESSLNVGFDPVSCKPNMEFCHNGDILIKGVLAENNKEIVQAAKEFFMSEAYFMKLCPNCREKLNDTV